MRRWLLLSAFLGAAPAPQDGVGDPLRSAVEAYRAGRYAEALAGFSALAAEDENGEILPEVWGDLALAALRERRVAEAEKAARELLGLDDAGERALGRFLLGQAAYERARIAEQAGRLPFAEPGVWQSAVEACERARDLWLAAARERGDWPEAARNAERASRWLDELRAARDASEPERRKEEAPEPPPPLEGSDPEERLPEILTEPLSEAELRRLHERMREKEREKRALRRRAFRARALGERDW